MIVLYKTFRGEMIRSEVRDSCDVNLEVLTGNKWVLYLRVSDVEDGSLYGRKQYINVASRSLGEEAIRRMCENVRFVDLTKFQEE